MTGGAGLGPAWLPPTAEELVARCPFDGHRPYNERATAMLANGELPVTRDEGPPGADDLPGLPGDSSGITPR